MNDSEIVENGIEEKSDNNSESEDSVEIIKEQFIRLAADFDNYRKRIAKNVERDRMRIKGEIIKPFLDIIDSMRAAKNTKYSEVDDFLEGLVTLNKQIEIIMENQGVVKIEGVGNDFDSRLHEAVDTLEKDNIETDKIVEIVSEGYLLDGEVLRPAKVIVSKQMEKGVENE